MATNVTTDAIIYMERKLKDKEIHLEKARKRMTHFNEVKLPTKKANPKNKNWQDRQPLDIENMPEVVNLKREISHYKLAIEAIKEKQAREEKSQYIFKRK